MKKFGLLILLMFSLYLTSNAQVANHIVIAEIYGGGGNTGSYYTHDYIILYNPTSTAIDVSNWSIQYTSANGINYSLTNLTGIIAPASYYSIQEAQGSGGTASLPFVPNVTGTISMSATAGKVALVNDQTSISGILDPNVIDFVGYGTTADSYEGSGPTSAPSNTSSIRRKDNFGNNTYGINGNGWDQDENATDFYTQNDLGNNPPLPVELTSFSAVTIGTTVKLSWQTATEVNNFGFDVERQTHTSTPLSVTSWEKIGFVNGNGNSNSPKSYFYEDKNLTAGKYLYRLKQIDNDGQFEYSKVVEVDLGTAKKFELSQNYPNPFNPVTTIRFNLPEAGFVKLTLFNVLGQQIRSLVNDYKEAGVHTINLDASELNSGIYIYKIESGLFTQTRKMTLLK